MRRWQNLVALAGALPAAGALLPLAPRARLSCIALACAAVVILFVLRLRAHRVRPTGAHDDVSARIARIRAARGPRRR